MEGKHLGDGVIEIPAAVRDEMVYHAVRELPNEACGLLSGDLKPLVQGGSLEAPPAARGLRGLARRVLRPAPEGGRRDSRVRRGLAYHPIRNADQSPVTYTFDHREQLAVEEEIDRGGRHVVGVFHSHTRTPAFPSHTDVEKSLGARLFYPQAYFVLVSLEDRDDPRLRAFGITDAGVVEQEVRIT